MERPLQYPARMPPVIADLKDKYPDLYSPDPDTSVLEWFEFRTDHGRIQICPDGWFPASTAEINKLLRYCPVQGWGWPTDWGKHNADAWHDVADYISQEQMPWLTERAEVLDGISKKHINLHVDLRTKASELSANIESGHRSNGAPYRKGEIKEAKAELKELARQAKREKKFAEDCVKTAERCRQDVVKLRANWSYICSKGLWEEGEA